MAITLATNSALARSSGLNPTCSFAGTPVVNSGLVVSVATFNATVTAESDNQGNAYTQRQTRQQGSIREYMHTAKATTSSGTVTVTVTSASGGDKEIAVVNFDGTDTAADPYDVGNNNFATDTSPTVTSSATTTVTPCAIVGALTHAGASTMTPTDAQILEEEDDTVGMPINVEWRRDTGAVGTKTSTWTMGSSRDWLALQVVLKEASAPAGLPPGLGPAVSLQQPMQAEQAVWSY